MIDCAFDNMDAGIIFVPEPVTLALLSLGGLFLTRKSKPARRN
ncbi:MAG: PEP-CTERM sorting domain-containing protein [Planctomycetota bacterium]|jgi:hypothetical protein